MWHGIIRLYIFKIVVLYLKLLKGVQKTPQLFFQCILKQFSMIYCNMFVAREIKQNACFVGQPVKRHENWLQWTIFLKFDVQKSFAHFSATLSPSEAVLYAKGTGESPLSRHIESCSWFQNILWSFENILIYINA